MGCMLYKLSMTPESFLRKMEEALDAETNTLKLSTQLDDLDWDSLAMISAIAIVDQFSGIVLKADVINQCKTLGDICDLADKRNG